MKGLHLFLFISSIFSIQSQNIPDFGNPSQLEIANWNIEWFGSTSNGPSDEALQQKTITLAIQKMNLDVWGLCEVSSAAAWDSLLSKLPLYGGVISTWSQTQKTALIYKKSQFNLLYSKHILNNYSTYFANGRLPLEVALIYNHNTKIDTIYFFVIHLKANVGTNTEKQNSLVNRKLSSEAIKGYLDTFGKNKKCMVIGDWNDDLDTSIYNNQPTPFKALLNDSGYYFFPTKKLTYNGKQSTVSYSSVIDHQCMNSNLKPFFKRDSCFIVRLDQFISNYGSTTSDHFPVFSRYDFSSTGIQYYTRKKEQKFAIYWDGIKLQKNGFEVSEKFIVFNLSGQILFRGKDIGEFIPEVGKVYVIVVEGNQYFSRVLFSQ